MTHEQADFDALASLLAAAILNENAFALLPRKLNRNVQAFIELYGGELSLIEFDKLPNRSVEKITLVDTQSLVTIKGMNKNTSVHIVDHHPKKADLPSHWTSVFENTGACATILVEQLQKTKIGLNSIQATLLIAGIYEDTGSLSYAGTTVRDMVACAYLLEQNASLTLAVDYLNPPLTTGQHQIYNRLQKNSSIIHIAGQNIILACADGSGLNEEIASIAHKFRDQFDPHALFLIVKTNEGIRMVARSSTDQINVGKIAEKFGGGGHARAAAALIHSGEALPTMDQVSEELKKLLPNAVEPGIQVHHIMSRDPMLITPTTSALEASHLMQRYGYEGYPVMDQGRIQGLLNRRSVDRAIKHQLNLTASSLMEAGDVSVLENDTLDKVQQIMTESGWGQIPVKSSESGQITGIVTRTDLIKALGKPSDSFNNHNNLAPILEKLLSADQISFLQLIATNAYQEKLPVYLVGGFVRDLLLERPGFDFDIVVEGDAINLARSLQSRYQGRINTHKRFGTAKWTIKDENGLIIQLPEPFQTVVAAEFPVSIDFISARTEFYDHPTALPEVERSSIKLDLHRRDFSINTLAMRMDGRHYADLYDYWGGLQDLQAGLIRVLHSLSFVDDPTRLIRAVRFEQRFGFEIEPRTLQLLSEATDLLLQVSGDRLRHELNLIFQEQNPLPALLRLDELGLLSKIHPDLTVTTESLTKIKRVLQAEISNEWRFPATNAAMPVRLTLVYITWLLECGKNFRAITKRLRMPAIVSHAIVQARKFRKILGSLPTFPTSQLTEILDNVPHEVLFIYHTITPEPQIREIIDRYLSHWQKVKPFTTGYHLQEMGIKPGPVYKEILTQLRNAWLDEAIHTVEEELTLLQQITRQGNDNN